MTGYDLLRAIGDTDETYLAESERYSDRPRILRKWAVTAASLMLITGLVLIPVKNGMLGCGAALPSDHDHVFYISLEKFIAHDGRDSLLANLSYEEGEITDYEMECIYDKAENRPESYYCSFGLADREGVTITISFSDTNRLQPEGERITVLGEEMILVDHDGSHTKIHYITDVGRYTVAVYGNDHREIALQVAEDLLTAE